MCGTGRARRRERIAASGRAHVWEPAGPQPATAPRFALLPEVWRFKLDPADVGRDGKWFATALDDAAWAEIRIGASWEAGGYEYDG